MPLFMLEPVELKEDNATKPREGIHSATKEPGSVSAGLQVISQSIPPK